MKKTGQIFGAVALSAVLATGTVVPAFANTVDDITGDDLQDANYNSMVVDGDNYWKEYDKNTLDDSGASTNVNIATYSSNYSVTVPLFAPFMLDTAGGTGIAPTNYGIKNGGEASVFVTDVTWTMTESSDWTFGAANGSDATPLDVVCVKNGAKPTMPTYGSFVITLTHDESGDAVETLVAAPTGTSGAAANNAATGTKKVKWTILPASGADSVADGYNAISLSIQGSKLYKALDNIQTNVAAIVYTVSSQAPADTATVTP